MSLSTIKTISQYAIILGVHPQTLRRYTREGKIPCFRTLGNHRRFEVVKNNDTKTLKIGYARVSSHDQKDDLVRQKEDIIEKAKPDILLSDIGSGLNYTKPSFKQLILLLLSGRVKELVLAHKDRLLRFGSEIVFFICKQLGVKITILYEEEAIEPTQRFCQDLVEIMTVFCSKIYGQRSHKNRRVKPISSNHPTNDQLCTTS